MARNIFLHICLSLTILLLIACRSTKKLTNVIIPDRTETEIRGALDNHNINYEWFCAEGKLKFTSPQQNGSAKAYIRIQRDAAIWMVFKKLSVEAARVMIRPDSFFVLYRLDQKFERGPTSKVLEKIEIQSSFSALQDYFIGNIPELDSATTNIYLRDQLWHAESDFENKLLRVLVDPVNLKIKGFDLFAENNDAASARYDEFKLLEHSSTDKKIVLPFKRDFNLDLMQYGQSRAIMELKKIEIDQPKSLRFSIPKHYQEIITLD